MANDEGVGFDDRAWGDYHLSVQDVYALTTATGPDGRPIVVAAFSSRSEGGKLSCYSADGTLLGEPAPTGHRPGSSVAVVDAGGKVLVACSGGDATEWTATTLRLLEVPTLEPRPPLLADRSPRRDLPCTVTTVAAVHLSDATTLLAAGDSDGTIRVWDPATRDLVAQQPFGFPVEAMVAVPRPGEDDLLATSHRGADPQLWDPRTGTPVGPQLGLHDRVSAIGVVPDPDAERYLLATGDEDDIIALWNCAGEYLGKLWPAYPTSAMLGIVGPAGESLLVCGYDGGVGLWDVGQRAYLADIDVGTPPDGWIRSMVAVPDGAGDHTILCAAEDYSIRRCRLSELMALGRPAEAKIADQASGG